jgi:hypothetical protein
MYASTLFANRASTYQCIFLTTIGSTLFISTCVYSTLNGNILSTTTLVCTSGIYSSLSGQRATASAGIASSIFSNQLIGSNVIGSTLSINNGVISTMNSMYGYSVSGFISSISSNVVSNTVIISSLNVPAVTPSNFYISTAQIVSLQVSSINSLSLGSDTTLTNTWVGQRALSNLTTGTNNTAYGNASLMFNTSGSYNTVYGISSMVYNSIGSYNTAVGEQAGLLAGFNGSNNIYVGYGATPSNISVINEIVIGGASAGGTNVGNGSNSLTLGNSATTTNVFYGSVGVGTTSPGTALDVRGSYQQIGGNMSVYNSSAAYVSLWLYSDGTSGCGWFLNSSTRNTDGGTYTATLRNDYGLLRLQSSGGITNPTNGITILANSGNVGINSNNPTNVLDVLGTMNVSGTLTASNIYCSSQILVNGISVTKIVQSQWNNTIPGVLYFNGNVGIGTTSLQSNTALTIYGSAEYIGNLRIGNTLCSSGSFTANSIDTQGGMFSCGSLTTSAVNAYGINANTFTGNIQANRINNGILLTSPMKSIWSIPGDCLFTSIQTKYPYVVDQNGDYIIDYINNTYVVQTTGPLNVAFPIFIMTARYSDVLRLQSFQTFNSTLDWRPQGGKIYMYNVYTYINSNYNGWAFQSDRRMKNNICPLESSLNEIIHIRPVSFMMKNNDSYSVGYIAQEVQPIFPLLVVKSNVKNEEYDSPLLSLNYNGFIPYYVKAFQQQHHMIEEHNTLYNNMKHYLEELNIQFESYNEEIQVLYDVISKQTMEITQLEHDILWMMS